MTSKWFVAVERVIPPDYDDDDELTEQEEGRHEIAAPFDADDGDDYYPTEDEEGW